MTDRKIVTALVQKHTTFSFARSGGAGGQNVNKVNTKVFALLPLSSLFLLPPEDLARLRLKLKNRLTKDEELFVQVQDERTQGRNREIALERLTDIIMNALKPVRKRKKTKPGKAAREARLTQKKIHARKKQTRQRPEQSD